MQAQTLSPALLFGPQYRYVVPLFQRPYVWTRKDQWEPLWQDIQTLTESVLEAGTNPYGGGTVPPHFLGAIVLDQQRIPAGFIATRHVIDGQQRLTTLQLLLDAAQAVVADHGIAIDAQALRVLVRNDAAIAQHPDEVFKVWPTDRDQDAFRAAMRDGHRETSPAETGIQPAHQYFQGVITEWALEAPNPDDTGRRLTALVRALREHLKLVVIDLEQGDNAQVIFETLNHRGSRLLAADLVKNFLFQSAGDQNADVTGLYRTYWRRLDDDVWRQQIAQGRFYRPRIDVFLNHWLTMTLLREVPADRVFVEFRDHVREAKPTIGELLSTLADDAAVYERMDRLLPESVEGRFHYRVVRALGAGVVGPFLLWILRWSNEQMPAAQRAKALGALESWIVRRVLCRASVKDLNRLVVELLRALSSDGPATAGDTVENVLATQTAESRVWPTDNVLGDALRSAALYRVLTRPRLRMVLEALEDSMRGPLGEGQRCPHNLSIEHVMPQAWREHWNGDIDANDPVAGHRRDRIVHTLGNLTLVTGKLNPTLSNRPWVTSSTGNTSSGKRSYLLEHSQLSLNAAIVAKHENSWSENDINTRTEQLIEKLERIWPRPATRSESGPLSADEAGSTDGLDTAEETNHSGKYDALRDWLTQQPPESLAMSFEDVETVLGFTLPPSARTHLAHWYGHEGTALGRAIRDAGWKASGVDLTEEKVIFIHTAAP